MAWRISYFTVITILTLELSADVFLSWKLGGGGDLLKDKSFVCLRRLYICKVFSGYLLVMDVDLRNGPMRCLVPDTSDPALFWVIFVVIQRGVFLPLLSYEKL